MTDFVDYEPDAHAARPDVSIGIRPVDAAEVDGLAAVDAEPEWLIAGLTVVPEARRRGVAARLLRGVLGATADSAPNELIFSVINARNRASIDLHERVGFIEVGRAATFAGIDFTGGEGVLLCYA